ncbi:uncharacterized protein LOC126204046 [Schistocerca nitens]|uniref:uncharacterized protein LOC126204046 n=1 Tax=Schistocerca nitens TaxID=7011 RepID=UPI0021178DE6|nr:uncharacterized protein LOC126204046 [Schistocerca nitens]
MRKQHGRTTAGYDHLLCLNHLPPDGFHMVARLEHPETGRALEVRTNQPCVHVYTGRRLPPWRPPKPRPPTPPTEDVEEEETTETDPASAAKTKSQVKSSSSAQPAKAEAEKQEAQDEEVVEEEEEDENAVRGKDGVRYGSFCGIWLAPQWFPNAIHMDRFPKCVVTPVKTYEHVTVYRFFAKPKPPRYSLAEDVVRASVETAIQEVETREAEPPPEQ